MSRTLLFPESSTDASSALATLEINSVYLTQQSSESSAGKPKKKEKTDDDGTATRYLLTMNNPPENRFTTELLDAMLAALDTIDRLHIPGPSSSTCKPAYLVLSGGPGRFFSNGLHLPTAGHPDLGAPYMRKFYGFLARVLAFPMPTVAAVNGHGFAGGCILAVCCDYRCMAEKRGWLSMNALIMRAEPGLPLHLILKSKLPPPLLRRVLLLAHRFPASEALQHGLIDAVSTESSYEALLETADTLGHTAAPMAKSGRYYGYMKQAMYSEPYKKCLEYTDEEAKSWLHEGSMYGRLAEDARFSGAGTRSGVLDGNGKKGGKL